jgi:deaminated glutathione amidase
MAEVTTGPTTFRVALTQCTATNDRDRNLSTVLDIIGKASGDRPDLILLPENCLLIGTNDEMRAGAVTLESAPISALRDAARAARTIIVLGGFKRRDAWGAVHNTALAIGPDGAFVGSYDKIHLFDAVVNGQSFEASRVEVAGVAPSILVVNGIRIAVTICYDVRFPELYRNLALAGAEIFLVPSAFTYVTGRAHWEVLLRARAIENGAFVIASATAGQAESFRSWGHALAVDPWGVVLADLGETPCRCCTLDLDLSRVQEVRRSLPVLRNVRTEISLKPPVSYLVSERGSLDTAALAPAPHAAPISGGVT